MPYRIHPCLCTCISYHPYICCAPCQSWNRARLLSPLHSTDFVFMLLPFLLPGGHCSLRLLHSWLFFYSFESGLNYLTTPLREVIACKVAESILHCLRTSLFSSWLKPCLAHYGHPSCDEWRCHLKRIQQGHHFPVSRYHISDATKIISGLGENL